VPNAAISPVAGASTPGLVAGLTNIVRSLYLYENDGVQAVTAGVGSDARSLYLYENDGIQAQSILARDLYLYESDGIQALIVLARSLYGYEATRDLPVVPWLERLDPPQQYPGGTVDLYGDGLGQYAEVGAASTITTSSVSGGNIGSNVVARTSSYWQSTDGTGAWIRFTLTGSLKVYAIALEDLVGAATNQWGVPLFRFSDGGADVVGGSAVPIPQASDRPTEYPVGAKRTLYVLPAERTVTWVEVRVSSGGAGTARGLSQAWVYADEGQGAETSQAILNALAMGAVTWSGRSVGLWPANGGVPQSPAATVTVPLLGTSGLVKVTES
jgi:hypothetical protein